MILNFVFISYFLVDFFCTYLPSLSDISESISTYSLAGVHRLTRSSLILVSSKFFSCFLGICYSMRYQYFTIAFSINSVGVQDEFWLILLLHYILAIAHWLQYHSCTGSSSPTFSIYH